MKKYLFLVTLVLAIASIASAAVIDSGKKRLLNKVAFPLAAKIGAGDEIYNAQTGQTDVDHQASSYKVGTSSSYATITTGANVYQLYGDDQTGTGYTDGFSSTLKATAGDGNGAVRPFQGAGTAAASSDLAELYGGSFYAIQNDGGKVRSNLYGVMGYAEVEETDAADDPTGYITGVLGIYDTNGIDPTVTLTTPGFKAALGGVVKDNANSVPHAAVMAFMEGDLTGTAVPAAFKAVSVRSTAGGGFTYGLDLYDEAGNGENIQTADVRGFSGNTIDNLTANTWKVSGGIFQIVKDAAAYLTATVQDGADAVIALTSDDADPEIIFSTQVRSHKAMQSLVEFYEEFLGEDLNVTDSFWSADKGTSNNGTQGITADGIAGLYNLTLVVNDEAQDLTLTTNDQLNFDAEKNPIIEFRMKVAQGGTAGGTLVAGFASAYNDDPDTVQESAWFKIADINTSLAVVCETDDNSANNDDVASGVTLTDDTFYEFKIDLSDPSDAKFYINEAEVCGATAFDFSNYTDNFQPYFHLSKASGAAVDVVTLDYVKVIVDR